jgi:hypothetical protein
LRRKIMQRAKDIRQKAKGKRQKAEGKTKELSIVLLPVAA